MKTKKSTTTDLERYRGLFFEIGFILTLGFVLLAFEWGVKPEENKTPEAPESASILQESTPVTTQTEPEQQTPPPPVPPEEIEIVIDQVEIKDDFTFGTTEIDPGGEIDVRSFNEPEGTDESSRIYVNVSQMPQFRGGGSLKFRNYVAENIQYPEQAKRHGVSGTIIVQFVIDERGEIAQVKLLRKLDPALDQEVLRVIRNAPGWTPGEQSGKKVKVLYSIPISFQLN